MTKWLIIVSILLLLSLPACRGVASDVASEPPLESSPVHFVTPTLAPPTDTPLPPSPTATQVVVIESAQNAQASDPEPTPPPTQTPLPEPTATPEPDWLNHYGRTADNLVYLGNPDAPVVFIDYSDFM